MSRALALAVFSSLVLLGAAGAGPRPLSDVAELARRAAESARALGKFYEAANDGAYEAYVARALAAHAPVGRSERCRLPSGALSRRLTVIANPPLARTSIAQREHLLSSIGSYEAVLLSIADKAERADVAVAEGDLQRELSGLGAAASAHAQGDLFIEDATKALTADAERLMTAPDATAQQRALDALDGKVRKLIGVLAVDAARQRGDTVDAAALAYRGWSSYGGPGPGASPSAARTSEGDPPACSEPAIYARLGRGRNDAGDPPLAAGRLHDRVARARERLDTVRAANPAAVLAAVAALHDSEMRVLQFPHDPAAAAKAKAALQRFDAIARDFAGPFQKRGDE